MTTNSSDQGLEQENAAVTTTETQPPARRPRTTKATQQAKAPQTENNPDSVNSVKAPEESHHETAETPQKLSHPTASSNVEQPRDNNFSGQRTERPRDNNFSGQRTGQPRDNNFSGQRTGQPRDNNFSGSRTGQPRDNNFSGQRTGQPRDNNFSGQRTGYPRDNNFSGQRTGQPRDNNFSGPRTGQPRDNNFSGPRTGQPRDNNFSGPRSSGGFGAPRGDRPAQSGGQSGHFGGNRPSHGPGGQGGFGRGGQGRPFSSPAATDSESVSGFSRAMPGSTIHNRGSQATKKQIQEKRKDLERENVKHDITRRNAARNMAAVAVKEPGPIELPSKIMVQNLAELLEIPVTEVIKNLIGMGVFANVNQTITYDVAARVATELGYTPSEAAKESVSAAKDDIISQYRDAQPEEKRSTRPPVVTVMGHVDHGKTSLLDAIRKTKVAAGEAGGITQHIGAYQVSTTDGRIVTFLDTPGHEAFTAMRARGAKVTDIAIIVVAADDGVMPQTLEAIDHARAAQVPIVIALNKIDKPNANPEYVKQQLADKGVMIEEYGGDVVCVPVSAKKGMGIEKLLEMTLLVADLLELKGSADAKAIGAVVESRLDKSVGVVTNLLVQDGTLKVGEIIVTGVCYGKIRAMFDDNGKRIRTAGPSAPVSVLGLSEVATAGERFDVVEDERSARQIIQRRLHQERQNAAALTLDMVYHRAQQGKIHELDLVLKADVQGSLDALRSAIAKVGTDNLKVRILHDGVGNITESDIHLAAASSAIVIGFNIKADPTIARLAQNDQVDIRTYDVIYKLLDDLNSALTGMLEPVYKDVVEGKAEVLQLFKSGKSIIAGCRVTDGKITRSAIAHIVRGAKEIYTGAIGSIRRGKDDAREVVAGYECGIVLTDFNDWQEGDSIEAHIKVRV